MLKRERIYGLAAVLLFSLLIASCKPFSGPLPGETTGGLPDFQHLPPSGSFTYSVDLGAEPTDVYFVFTNKSTTEDSQTKPRVEDQSIVIDGKGIPAPVPQRLLSAAPVSSTMDRIREFNRDPFSQVQKLPAPLKNIEPPPPIMDAVNDTDDFWWDTNWVDSVASTCRSVVSGVGVDGSEQRTLNIWVADDCWDDAGGTNSQLVTQAMVDALAARFLKTSLDNDIYDWVRGIVGKEWDSHIFTNLIQPESPVPEITILLYDIDDDNSANGGVVGYFWAKDNFESVYVAGSNERIMFYIDAVMYANPDGAWEPTDYWPEEIYSTLAHELQHMIHFYQKSVVQPNTTSTDTWINEMCSQVVEDLLAYKLKIFGPRGVEGTVGTAGLPLNGEGRLPLFNYYNDIALIDLSGTLASYSISYAFGAYLARNFGGANLVRAIVQGSETDEGAITEAVSAYTNLTESFAYLLQRWGAAVLLSDRTDTAAGYRFNTGNFFTSTTGGGTYKLGSINLFNYRYPDGQGGYIDGPYLYSGTGSVGDLSLNYKSSNVYYQAGLNLIGSQNWTIELPGDVVMSVVFKD